MNKTPAISNERIYEKSGISSGLLNPTPGPSPSGEGRSPALSLPEILERSCSPPLQGRGRGHSHQLKGRGGGKMLIISSIYLKKSTGLRIFMVTKP